ncbi:MAG: hypothetical protein ABIQ47_04230 [Tepidiformaceae bacterium]
MPLDVEVAPPAYIHRLRGNCRCGVTHDLPPPPPPPLGYAVYDQPSPPMAVCDRDRVYREALNALSLRRSAVDDLRRRGLSPEDIERFGFRSLPLRGGQHAEFMARMRSRCDDDVLGSCPGFVDKNGRLTFWAAYAGRDGYIVPFIDDVGQITGIQAKLLGGRYLTPYGARYADMYVVAGTPSTTLFLVEGGLKALVASVLGPAWCLGVPGQALQDAHLAVIRRLCPQRVAVALDREVNINTDRARERWLERIAGAGLAVYDAVWEGN